jgi:hypothetical protein
VWCDRTRYKALISRGVAPAFVLKATPYTNSIFSSP